MSHGADLEHHHADGVGDDVVQFACDACAFLGDGDPRGRVPLVFGQCRPHLRRLGLLSRSRSANPASQLIANWSGMKMICGVEWSGIVETTMAEPATATTRPMPACRLFRRFPAETRPPSRRRKRLIGERRSAASRRGRSPPRAASTSQERANGKRRRAKSGEIEEGDRRQRQNHSVVVGAPEPSRACRQGPRAWPRSPRAAISRSNQYVRATGPIRLTR